MLDIETTLQGFVRRRLACACLTSLALASLVGCGDRNSAYDEPFVRGDSVGLTGSVAVVDSSRNELMMLTSPEDNELAVSRLRVGKNIVTAAASADRKRLFVLSKGEERRLRESDEKPKLIVVDGSTTPSILASYELGGPAQKLVLDPRGEWAVVYDAGGVVVNSNELVLLDLGATDPTKQQFPTTLRSTGGQPEHFTFTSPLTLPSGVSHRLLVVETNQDLSIIDLSFPAKDAVRVSLPKTKSGDAAQPAAVAFHDDSGATSTGSYLAVAFANDSSVLTLKLSDPTEKSVSAITVTPNLLDAGAVPSTIDFVETDSGLRLAALVPTQKTAILFDPSTSKSEKVQFDRAYSGISRVTGLVSDTLEKGDVALLYSATDPTIAFWRLGVASSTPYASYDSYGVDARVTSVLDIPGTQFGTLKLLIGSSDTEFFLLDLKKRESYPMKALSGFTLRLSPDGLRAWAFPKNQLQIAELGFVDNHPTSYAVERPVIEVFDIQRADGGRSALALHASQGTTQDLGVTLFDAEHPDSAHTRFVSGLMLEGLQ